MSTAANKSFLKASGGVGVWAFDEEVINLDIVSLDTQTTYNIVMPHTGTILTMYSVIDSAIATNNATLQLAVAGVNVTGGLITITASGSAAGDVDSATPSALNTATAGQRLGITVGGSATGAARCHVSIIFLRTA